MWPGHFQHFVFSVSKTKCEPKARSAGDYWSYEGAPNSDLRYKSDSTVECKCLILLEAYRSVSASLAVWRFGRGGCGVAKVNGSRAVDLTGERWAEPWGGTTIIHIINK